MRDPVIVARARDRRGRLRAKHIDGYKFRRQYPIGQHIVDFASVGARLVVEIDCDFHGSDQRERLDRVRTQWLEAHGWTVIRFWSSQLHSEMDWIIDQIREACNRRVAMTPP